MLKFTMLKNSITPIKGSALCYLSTGILYGPCVVGKTYSGEGFGRGNRLLLYFEYSLILFAGFLNIDR